MAPHLTDSVTMLKWYLIMEYCHGMYTRSACSLKVIVPKPNLECFKKSFKYSGAHVWNGLPDYLHNASSLDNFKLLYKKKYFTASTWVYRIVSSMCICCVYVSGWVCLRLYVGMTVCLFMLWNSIIVSWFYSIILFLIWKF